MFNRKYSPESIERIKEKEVTEISDFLYSVPQNDARQILHGFPAPRGFRANTKAGIKAQKDTIAMVLSGGGATSNKIKANTPKALAFFWSAWGKHKLNARKIIDEYINEIDEALENKESEKTLDDIDKWLFQELRDSSLNNECTKEDLEKFLEFSPLDDLDEIKTIIASAKPASAIEQELRIESLPQDLGDIRENLESQAQKTSRLQKNQTLIRKSIDEMRVQFDVINDTLDLQSNKNKKLNELKKNFEEFGNQIDELKSQSQLESDSLDSAVTKTQDNLHNLQRDLFDEISSISAMSKELEKSTRDSIEELEKRLLNKIEQIQEKGHIRSSDIQTLEDGSDCAKLNEVTSRRALVSPKVSHIEIHHPPTKAESLDSLRDCLSMNLQSIGIIPSESKSLGSTLLATLISQQMPFLVGRFARKVAEAVVWTLAPGTNSWLNIEIGVTATVEINSLSTYRGEDDSDSLLGVTVIEGINNSPFSVYGSQIQAEITNRIFGLEKSQFSSVFIGIIETSNYALPISDVIGTVGPIIDLDAVKWRFGKETPNFSAMEISVSDWDGLVRTERELASMSQTIDDVLEDLDQHTDLAWKYMVSNAHSTQLGLRPEKKYEDSILSSTAKYWLIPRYLTEKGGDLSELSDLARELINTDQISKQLKELLLSV